MIKKIAWNTFKNTGDVNTYLELKQIQNIEQQMKEQNDMTTKTQQQIGKQNNTITKIQQQMEEQNGNNQNEWYNHF